MLADDLSPQRQRLSRHRHGFIRGPQPEPVSTPRPRLLELGLEWVLHSVMIFDTKTDILEAYRDYQAQTRATGKATLSSRGPGEIP